MKIIKTTLLASSILAFNVGHAAIIMIDFGPTSPTGDSLTNSPAHAASAAGVLDNTWNVLGTSGGSTGTVSSLQYSDGSSATGVSFTYGSTPLVSGSKVVDYTLGVSGSSALGAAVTTDAFVGDSVGKDAIFNGSGSTNDFSMGLRFDGLTAGTYDLYVVSQNTSTAGAQSYDIFTSVGASSNSYDFGSETASASFTIDGVTTWVEGNTYGVSRVTVGSGQSVFLGVDGTQASQNRAFLNALQIVSVAAVPEPSVISAFVGLLATFGVISFRKFKYRAN